MSGISNPRLEAAVSQLTPADRALLSLHVDRDLPDQRIAQLTGVDSDEVTARRERILAELGASAGLPSGEVARTLRAQPDEPEELPSPPAPEPPPRSVAPEPAPPGSEPEPRRRPNRVHGLLAACVVAAVVVVIVLVASSGGRRHPSATTAASSTPTVTSTPTTTSSATAAAAAVPPISVLRPLPGGPPRAHGTAHLIDLRGTEVLVVRVSRLPRLRRGHYELYLFNSLLDSRALGRVRVGRTREFRLRAGSGDYGQLDVSQQPRGATVPSGESRLRGANPARS